MMKRFRNALYCFLLFWMTIATSRIDATASTTDVASLGPSLVEDINTQGLEFNMRYPVDMNGVLFFSADDGVDKELWRSDGTDAGTYQVKDINPGVENSDPSYLTVVGSTLFFIADDGVHGPELWKSDGTPQGTLMVKDIYPGVSGSGTVSYTHLTLPTKA